MRKVFSIAGLVLGLTGFALAQKPAQSPAPAPAPPQAVVPCPAIVLVGPGRVAAAGETIRYSARIDTSNSPLNLEFKWTVNPATVFAGQGGSEIEFERPARENLTVSLEVLGLPAHCPRNAAETSAFDPGPMATQLDQVLGPLPKTMEARVKRLTDRIKSRPDAQLYIVLEYGSDEAEPAAKEKGRVVASFIQKSGLDNKRVSYIIGKTKRDRVQFWLVPPGAEYPKIEK